MGAWWVRGIVAALVAGSVPGTACAETPAPTPARERVAIRAIAADPAAWVGRNVTIAGTLANEGTNYFTDLRIVLKDDAGRSLPVKPWLPTGLPPGPGPGPRPKTLSQFLGHSVELEATVREGELRAAGKTFHLEVRSARTLPP